MAEPDPLDRTACAIYNLRRHAGLSERAAKTAVTKTTAASTAATYDALWRQLSRHAAASQPPLRAATIPSVIDLLIDWADACRPASTTIRSALAALNSVLAVTPGFQENPAGRTALERTSKALQRDANGHRPPVPRVAGAPPDGIGGFLDRLLDAFKRRGEARTFKDVRDRLVTLLAVDLLGRNSDIARLRLNDVSLDHSDDMHITLCVRGDKAHVAKGQPHGGHAVSHIFCSTPVQLCTVCTMRKYLALRPAGGEYLLVKAPAGTSSVSTVGHELKPATVAHILGRSLSDAGAPHATPHTIRGMGASALFAASWDERRIRRAGRWANINSVRPYTAASLTGILPLKNLAFSYANHGACILTKERRWYAGATLRRFMARGGQ